MSQRKKREVYRALSGAFGDPTKMSLSGRMNILNLLSGWLLQHPDRSVRKRLTYEIPSRGRYTGDKYVSSIYEKGVSKAYHAAPSPKWHWKIDRLIRCPPYNDATQRLGVEAIPTGLSSLPGEEWNYIKKLEGKRISIVFPVNYHLTVARHNIKVVDKKIVQRIWNHRSYTDKDVWECSYWDFSKLTSNESSWIDAKWRTGFVVKMAVATAVEENLSRALSVAHSRVVRAGINSILSDVHN